MLDVKEIEAIIRRDVRCDMIFGLLGVEKAAVEIALLAATKDRKRDD